MSAEPRLAVAEHACALSAQLIARGDDVFDLVTEVMHPAFGMAFQKTAHRRIAAEGFEQLDPRVRQLNEHHRYAMRRQCLRFRDTGPECAAVELARCREI